jgi:hypothetical protein
MKIQKDQLTIQWLWTVSVSNQKFGRLICKRLDKQKKDLSITSLIKNKYLDQAHTNRWTNGLVKEKQSLRTVKTKLNLWEPYKPMQLLGRKQIVRSLKHCSVN